MAFLDHEGHADFPYHRDQVMGAITEACNRIRGMTVASVDDVTGRIVVKSGASLMSWGENVPIQVSEDVPGRTRVSITSTPKTGVLFGGAMDLGKNRANIEKILAETSSILADHPPADIRPEEPVRDTVSRLDELESLLGRGLITEEEYKNHREDILRDI